MFDTSEADYLRYSRLAGEQRGLTNRESAPTAQVRLADETTWKRQGKIDFVDNAFNARSGTIRSRAVFENKDQFLTPGTFGRVRIYAGQVDALLVPDAVIVSDQASKIVLTVGADNKVVPKPVVLGQIADGLRVITKGLEKDDKVIVNGLASPMVRPGATVTPQAGEIKVAATN